MTREMQKAERELPLKRVMELIEKGDQGILCVNGDDGYPYAIPTHYIYMNDAIYIHSAKIGYKVEALGKDTKVCFTSVLYSEPIPELFTTRFESHRRNGQRGIYRKRIGTAGSHGSVCPSLFTGLHGRRDEVHPGCARQNADNKDQHRRNKREDT